MAGRRWDVHVMFADAFGWSQQEVDAMDTEYAEELLAFLRAKALQEKERHGRESHAR